MVKSKTSKLEQWQIEDANRLLHLYNAYRSQGGLKQEEFAHKFGLKSQANLGHYLHGRSPLNISQAKNFAAGLGCSIADFSPRLAKEAAEAGALASGEADTRPQQPAREAARPSTAPTPTETLTRLGQLIAAIDPPSRAGLTPLLAALVIGPDSQDTIEAIKDYLENAPAKKRNTPEFGAHQQRAA